MNVPPAPGQDPHYADIPQPDRSTPSWVRAIGASESAAGYARIVGLAFPVVLAVVGWLLGGAITTAMKQMGDLSTSVASINSYLAGAQSRAAERDRRLDRLETSDNKELVVLQDHEHRLTVLEQAALAEHERRLDALEAEKRTPRR